MDIKVDLPGVGENVQDHLHASIIYELDPKTYHETFDLMRDPEYAAAASKLLFVAYLFLLAEALLTSCTKWGGKGLG